MNQKCHRCRQSLWTDIIKNNWWNYCPNCGYQGFTLRAESVSEKETKTFHNGLKIYYQGKTWKKK